jgi:hypothetical protein
VLFCSIAGSLFTDAHLFEGAGLTYGFGLALFVFLVPSAIPTGQWWQLWQWKRKTCNFGSAASVVGVLVVFLSISVFLLAIFYLMPILEAR